MTGWMTAIRMNQRDTENSRTRSTEPDPDDPRRYAVIRAPVTSAT